MFEVSYHLGNFKGPSNPLICKFLILRLN